MGAWAESPGFPPKGVRILSSAGARRRQLRGSRCASAFVEICNHRIAGAEPSRCLATTILTDSHDATAAVMRKILLRATIDILVKADGFVEAAEHQKRLQSHFAKVTADYPEASMKVATPRSLGRGKSSSELRAPKVHSGRASDYD